MHYFDAEEKSNSGFHCFNMMEEDNLDDEQFEKVEDELNTLYGPL